MKTFRSSSSKETKKFAESLAKKILKRGPRKKDATVLALYGDLGAGKTTFVQGFYKGLGLKTRVTSPTFILMRRTAMNGKHLQHLQPPKPLQQKIFTNVFHIDLYRLRHNSELAHLKLKDVFSDPSHIVLIEWPERASRMMPPKRTQIIFKHGAHEHERMIQIK